MADKPAPLVPIREEMVPFYDDLIPAAVVETEDGGPVVYVAVGAVCEFLGISWKAQRRRINDDEVLSEAIKGVTIWTPPSEDGRGGGSQTVQCLPLKFLYGWLFGIQVSKTRPELRDALNRYRRECFDILSAAFAAGNEERDAREALARTEALGLAIAETSRASSEGIGAANRRIDRAGIVVRDLASEVAAIKLRLGAGAPLTPEQAQAVKTRINLVAGVLGGVPGYGGRRKPYAAAWQEVYHRFGVPSYSELRQHQYESVIQFLDQWYVEIQEGLEQSGGIE